MNAPTEVAMKTSEVLQVELEVLRGEHRDLNDAISALQDTGGTALIAQGIVDVSSGFSPAIVLLVLCLLTIYWNWNRSTTA